MAAQKRKTTLHGVEVTQTQLQGNWYTVVDGRIKIAEHADPALIRRKGGGYHVVKAEFVQMGERWAYHCLVEYPVGSGVITPGSDFIDMKDPSGLAKAETSAIGRALGLHGIAIEESIASAEEMGRVAAAAPEMDEGERVVDTPVERRTVTTDKQPQPPQANGNAAKRQPAQPRQPEPQDDPPIDPDLDERLDAILKRHPDLRKTYEAAKQLGVPDLTGNAFFTRFVAVAKIAKKQDLLDKPITVAHKEKMAAFVTTKVAEHKAKALAAGTTDLATLATPGVRP